MIFTIIESDFFSDDSSGFRVCWVGTCRLKTTRQHTKYTVKLTDLIVFSSPKNSATERCTYVQCTVLCPLLQTDRIEDVTSYIRSNKKQELFTLI